MRRVVHVWYDDAGNIAAVGQPVGGHRVVPCRRPGLQAIEVMIDSNHIADLHHTHRADPHTGRLIRRDVGTGDPGAGSSGRG